MAMIHLPNEAATTALGREIAQHVCSGDLLLLEGNLGAGKTTFVRALVEALGGDPLLVHSPTFSLVHRYDTTPAVFHLDCYRLGEPDEWYTLGIEEELPTAITCIEWPSRVADVLPESQPTWQLNLDHDGQGGRQVQVVAPRSISLQGQAAADGSGTGHDDGNRA